MTDTHGNDDHERVADAMSRKSSSPWWAGGAAWEKVRKSAEAPRDAAERLERWRQVAGGGRFPVAIVHVVKYLLVLGRRAEAVALARTDLTGFDDPWLDLTLIDVLAPNDLAEFWDAAAARMIALRASDDFPVILRDRALVIVATKMTTTGDLTVDRAWRWVGTTERLLAFGAFDDVAPAGRAGLAQATMCRCAAPEQVATIDRLIDERTARCLPDLPGEPVVASLDRFVANAVRSRHREAWFAHVLRQVFPRLGRVDRLRTLTRLGIGRELPGAVAAEIGAATAAGRPWDRARLLEHVFADPIAVATRAIRPILGRATAAAPTAVAGLIGAVATAGFASESLDAAQDTARRLMAMAAWRECALYVASQRHASPVLADFRAFALAELARDPTAVWTAIPAAQRSRRAQTALAFARLGRLDHAGATAALAALPPATKQVDAITAWRDRLRFHRLAGDRAALEATLAAPPVDDEVDVLAEERLRHHFETGDFEGGRSMVARMPRPIARSLGVRRILAHQAQVDQTPEIAAEMWRAIDARSGQRADRHCLVMALYAAGRFEEARTCAELSMRDFPGDARFAAKAAQGWERAGEIERALALWVTAAERPLPDPPTASQGIARCLIDLERWDEAVDWLESLPQDDPEFLWVHGHRAVLEARRGDDDATAAALGRMQRIMRRLRTRIELRLARDPDLVWTGRGFVRHGHRAAAAHERHCRAAIDGLRAADSVALVGNGPSLTLGRAGAAIDAHDHVVRLNDFVLAGYEDRVGSRTDLWISSANRLAAPGCKGFEATRTLLLKPSHEQYPDLVAHVRGRLRLEIGDAAVGFLPVHWHILTTALGYARPSTGFRAMLMLEFVADIDYTVYGFDFFDHGRLHYFDEAANRLQVGEVHAPSFERDFATLVLARHGRARFAETDGEIEA